MPLQIGELYLLSLSYFLVPNKRGVQTVGWVGNFPKSNKRGPNKRGGVNWEIHI